MNLFLLCLLSVGCLKRKTRSKWIMKIRIGTKFVYIYIAAICSSLFIYYFSCMFYYVSIVLEWGSFKKYLPRRGIEPMSAGLKQTSAITINYYSSYYHPNIRWISCKDLHPYIGSIMSPFGHQRKLSGSRYSITIRQKWLH